MVMKETFTASKNDQTNIVSVASKCEKTKKLNKKKENLTEIEEICHFPRIL